MTDGNCRQQLRTATADSNVTTKSNNNYRQLLTATADCKGKRRRLPPATVDSNLCLAKLASPAED